MLEKYVAALLVPYLSKYVENINEDQLKINIWNGKATLNDLVLRPEALDVLLGAVDEDKGAADTTAAVAPSVSKVAQKKRKSPALLVRAHRGICKSVSLSIPIKHLRSEPVVVEVGELLLTLRGVSDLASVNGNIGKAGAAAGEDGGGITSSDGLRNIKAEKWDVIAEAKAAELQAFEAERKRQREQKEQTEQQTAAAAALKDTDNVGSQKSGGGFFSRLGELVINNVIVKVQTVHIRYEDEANETIIGAVLGGVELLTMNGTTGQPMFTDPSGLQKMWKRLVFNDLQVYCDDPSLVRANAPLGRSWYTKIVDWQQWYHRMRQRARDGAVAQSTILGPVSGVVDAKVVFKMFVRELLNTPYTDVSLKLQHVMTSLTRAQYTKILQTVMLFANQTEVSELRRMRPRVPVKGHAWEWWRYAIRAVLSVIEEPKRELLLARVSAACKLDYQVLYRDVVRQTEMSPGKKKTYRFITRFMTVEDMKAGRKYVYAQIANEIQMKRKDNEIRKAEEMAKQHQANIQQQKEGQEQKAQGHSKRGWFSWLVGSGVASSPNDSMADTATAKEIEEDEKFFKAVESEYGISSADSEAYQSAAVAFQPEAESGLPPSYCWLRATFELPFTSYRIVTDEGHSVTLKIFHLCGGVTSFNKPGSLLFYFRTQNIILANPATSSMQAAKPAIEGRTTASAETSSTSATAAASPASGQGCGALVPYLVEGVQVNCRASKSSLTGERVTVRSLTSVDCGKQLPSAMEAPTIYDVVDAVESKSPSPPPSPPLLGRQRSTSGNDDMLLPPQELPTVAEYATPLFSITGFLNPVEQPLADTTVDVAVKVQLLPLRIVADPITIEHLLSFFVPPAGVDVSGVAEPTKHAASAVGSAASQELRAAMAKAKGLYITVDVSAPVLILPKNLTANAQETALAVSLGRVCFHARPLSESEKQRRLTAASAFTDKPPSLADAVACRSPTTGAAAQESLFYYPHKASFSKFYLELTTVENAMLRPQRGFLLIPAVSIAADVLQRIDDRNTLREAFVLRLKVPSLRVACSLHQVYLITSLADAWTAHLRSNNQNGLIQEAGGDAVEDVRWHAQGRSPPVSELMELQSDNDSENNNKCGGGDHDEEAKSKLRVKDTQRGPPPGSPGSNAPAKAAVSFGDAPITRLELLVERLGLDVHDDDAETLAVSPLPVCRVECVSAELILAVRSHHKKMVLFLKEPQIVAAGDSDRPILSCGGVRMDVVVLEGETPTGVAVSLDGALNLCVGTPCVEMLETAMDVVNLILSTLDKNEDNGNDIEGLLTDAAASGGSFLTVSGGRADMIVSAFGKDLPVGMARTNATMSRSTNPLSDLAYQMYVVRQQCAMPNRHIADIFVRVQGPAAITLLNRAPGETVDTAFASATVSDVEMRLSKYDVTMDLSGRVGAVTVSVLEPSGLAEENRALLTYTPTSTHPRVMSTSEEGGSRTDNANTAATEKAKSTPPVAVHRHACSSQESAVEEKNDSSTSSALSCSIDAETTSNGHITFSFRKSRPVMPFFKEVAGRRVLANAQELRYSSALELLVGSSTIMLDLNTVMVLKTYFFSGLLSRLTRLGDRPLYNGRTLPPAREGPRLLMSFRVVVRDTIVILPVDPRVPNTQRFCASLGSLVLENSLHTAECKETMNISFGELGMWREEPVRAKGHSSDSGNSKKDRTGKLRCTTKHSALLPKQTYLETTVRTPLDLLSDDAPHIDIRSEDVSLELRETDLVQLVTLLRQNLMRTDQVNVMKYTIEAPELARQVVVGEDGRVRLRMQSTSCRAAEGLEDPSMLVNTAETMTTSFSVSTVVRATKWRNEEMFVSLHLGRISVLLSDRARGTTGDPITSSASRFQLLGSGLAISCAMPSNHIGVHWKNLQLDDVRDNSRSALLVCNEGSLQFAESLTTQNILMCEFGVRRNALRSVNAGEWKMGSVTSSSSGSYRQSNNSGETKQGGANTKRNEDNEDDRDDQETFSLPEVDAERKSRCYNPCSHDAHTNTQLLTISVISADFTLRRLAVSDQWLALYDVTCNEAVTSAWAAAQTGMSAGKPASATKDGQSVASVVNDASALAKKSGVRIFVTTPSVVIPFLNSRRETLIEANIAALLVDVAQLPNASTQVAVKVREMNVVDTVSGEKIIFRRSPTAAVTTVATTTTTTMGVSVPRTSTNCSASSPAGSCLSSGAAAAVGNIGSASHTASSGPNSFKTPVLAEAPATQDDWEDGWEDVDTPFSPLLGTKAGGGGSSGNTHCASGNNNSNYKNDSAVGSPAAVISPRGTAAPPMPNSSAADEPELLQFTFKSNPMTNTNKVQLGIGALHVLFSMPVINGLVDYFTSPYEPLAKIGNLGVMREQRARMAAAAQQMANKSDLVLHLLWRQPRIVLAADGLHLKLRRSSNFEMRLGVMRAAVHLKSASSALSVVVKVQEYSIPSLLKRSSVRFAYKNTLGAENIDLNMDRTTAQFHPTDVERFILVCRRNIWLPREVNYYGAYQKASPPATSPVALTDQRGIAAASSSSSSAASLLPPASNVDTAPEAVTTGSVPPLPVRTIQVHIDGFLIAIHDAVGLNTHTLAFSAFDSFVAADGSVEVLVPSFNLLDQSTNRYLVQGNPKGASREPSPNPNLAASISTFAQAKNDNDSGSRSPKEGSTRASSASSGYAVRVFFDSVECVANAHIGVVLVTVIPRSIGSLANSLLSLHIPPPPPTIVTATSATTVAGPLLVTANSRSLPAESIGTLSQRTSTTWTTPAAALAAKAHKKPFKIMATLSKGKVRFCQGEREVALLRLSGIACNSVSHTDGTNELSITLGNLFMVDSMSVTTNFRTFIYPYKDDDGGKDRDEDEDKEGNGSDDVSDDENEATRTSVDPAAATASPSPANAAGGGNNSTSAATTTAPPPAAAGVDHRSALSSSTVHVPVVRRQGVVLYEVRTLPSAIKAKDTQKSSTGGASLSGLVYTKQMRCRVESLSFIFVPDVVHALLEVVREVQTYVSEGNRDKAYYYFSDRAAKSVQRVTAEEQLTEVDIVVSRPQIFLVDKPTATAGVQLSPGSLFVKSSLVVPGITSPAAVTNASLPKAKSIVLGNVAHDKAEEKLALQPHEVFNVQVRKLGVLLQEANCFQKDCNIFIEFQRSLAVPAQSNPTSSIPSLGGSSARNSKTEATSTAANAVPVQPGTRAAASTTSSACVTPALPSAAAGDAEAVAVQTSLLKLDIPVLSMNFTQQQTNFAMDVLGALMKGSAVSRAVRTIAPAAIGSGDDDNGDTRRSVATSNSVAAVAGNVGSSNNAPDACATNNSSSYGGGGRKVLEHLYNEKAVVPLTAFSVDAHIGMLQADLADLFRLHVDEVRVQSTDTSTMGRTIDTRVDSVFIQHVGAEVSAENDDGGSDHSGASPGGASMSGVAASVSHPGGLHTARKTARIKELVDLLVVSKLHVRYVQLQPSVDVETASSTVESTVNVSAGVFNIAVSPTILFDTRELLYLPFCYKVLRVPIDPIPVLDLIDETTALDGDIVLDDKHVLLTASRTRCCYELNLNKHKLVLTGAPSGQIVLCEGCELTITNGTVCIPGMYTIGSYVSFAPCTALFTTDSCKLEKEFLNVANSAFFDSIIGRPSFAARSLHRANNINNTGSSQLPPNTVRSSDVSVPSPATSIDAFGATAAPCSEPPVSDSVIDLRDRTVRVIANFYCDNMQLQMLSEEVVDLSVSLHMQTRVKFVQDWENEQPAQRIVSVQMTSVRSGEDDEHILLPTDIAMNVSGVDNINVSLIFDSVEFCTRTTLLRSLVELGKDFGTAFIEENTVTRVKPRIEYETQSLDALYPVLEAGECQHCGRDIAYLALANDKPGILCYKCCTGYDSLPAIDLRVEVPLVDGVLFGSSGDMAHLYMRNLLLSVNPSMDLELTMRMSFYGFNNAAAVWEPAVEQFDATITGSVSTHDYRVRMDRLDYVLSPQNIRLLSGMVADYGAATALQKQLRKRFRRQKRQRTQQVAPNQGVAMYVNADLLEEVARVALQEEEMTLAVNDDDNNDVSLFRPMGVVTNTSPAYPPLNDIEVSELANTSVFDILNSTNRRLIAGAMGLGGGYQDEDMSPAAEPPKRGYAHVYVKNHCNVPLLVEGRRVTPRGGTLRFIARDSTVKLKPVVLAEDEGQGEHEEDYATSISNPPLYVQTKDMVLETKVVLSQEDRSRYLRRTITMTVYPLHVSRTIICLENRLHCPLASTGNYPPVKPGERFYLAPKTDLNSAISIQPVNAPDRMAYEVGKVVGDAIDDGAAPTLSKDSNMPSIQDVLCGVPMVLMCKAKGHEDKSMTVKIYVRQEEMRGGLPTFIITVEPRFHLRNKLPYRLVVNVLPDPSGDLARGRTPARPVQPLVSTALEVRQGADLFLNSFSINQIAFLLEVRQRRPPKVGGNSKSNNNGALEASTSLTGTVHGGTFEDEEVFSSLVPVVISAENPYISLRSQYRRELLIHAVHVPSKGSVVFTTPFVLVNHSPLWLTVRECTPDGANKLYDAEPNYSVLHPEMNASVAAAPMGIKVSEDFFVNIYHEQYRGSCVPLHAQQRGVVILHDCTASKSAKTKSSSSCGSGSKKKSDGGSAAAAARVSPTVIHLAYSSQVDPCGSLLVTIAPRWVVVNRSHLPLYVAPSTYNGITAKEARAAATAAMIASQQNHTGSAKAGAAGGPEADVSLPASPTQQQEVDNVKNALQGMMAENSILFLSDAPTKVTPLPPYSATPFYETPFCTPEVGYNIHVLQSPLSPLYGTPVCIENIHSELIVMYKQSTDPHHAQDGDDGFSTGCNGGQRKTSAYRDRFLEVSLVVRDPYTYIVLEPPERAPYILLNRTSFAMEVLDTASKSKGRLMARVQAGCGTDLILDTTVTTLMQVRLFAPDGSRVVYEVVFDVGRPMARREMSAALSSPAGVIYTLGYGGFGQQIIDISPAVATLQPVYTSVAAPPIPINVLLNLGVATLSVVMPNRDILFCAVTDIRFSWERHKDHEVIKFSIENFQVDNQAEVSPRYDSCILSLRTSSSFAAVSGYVERVLIPAKGLICLDEVRLDFVPLALRVSDTLLVACAGFVQAVRSGDDAPQESAGNQSMLSASASTTEMQEAAAAPHERCPSATKLYTEAPVQMDIWASKLSLERFIINPIIVRIWLTRDIEEHDFFRENIRSKDAALLSMLVTSCEDVIVAAPGIVTAKQTSRLGVFAEWITKTYQDGLLAQLKGLLLQYASSLPMIGAPLKLASGFGNGAVRLFRDPIDGLSTSPSAFAQGLARGSAGFAQEFAGGGLGAFSNFTDSWSRLLSMGGGVSEKERRKQNTLSGFSSGFMGIIQRPMEGAAESGAAGFLKGAAQGLVGVMANPMSGLLSDVSRATGTLGKLVTDTYIPKTHRLRPIRDFHANGGVAPWRSLVSVYQYQRIKTSTRVFSGDQLLSSVDGPEWYPSRREGATYGRNKVPIPAERWMLDRYHTNFEGWSYSTRYYGLYSERLTPEVRVRRMRWTALIWPLPYSRVAFFLRIAPGMETQQRRAGSSVFSSPGASPQETVVEFTAPGQLQATTIKQVKERKKRFFGLLGVHHSRPSSANSGGSRGSNTPRKKTAQAASEYFAEEEYANQRKTLHQRMRNLTATGHHVGVKTDALRGRSSTLGNDGDFVQGGRSDTSMYIMEAGRPSGSGTAASVSGSPTGTSGTIKLTRGTADLLSPDAPRKHRKEKKQLHSRSASELDATSDAGALPPEHQGSAAFVDGDFGKKGNIGKRDKNVGAMAAATLSTSGEAQGSKVPQPGRARFSRSNSGKVETQDATAGLAAVPGASPTFVSRTSGTSMAHLPTTVVEIYEYERKVALVGWGKRYLPSECPGWQDVHGNEVPSRQNIRAPAGWTWTTDWTIIGGDSNGWMIVNEQKNLRRRMWQRRLVKQPPSHSQPE